MICRHKKAAADKAFAQLDHNIVANGYTEKEIKAVRAKRTRATNRYFETDDDCRAYEDELDIPIRWLPGSPEYQEATQLLTEREYRRSLDELERLVVQRLFELTKAGMSGTGMYFT